MPPSTPPSSTTREFADVPDVPDEDEELSTTMMTNTTNSNSHHREANSVNGAQAQLELGRVEVVRRRVTRSGKVKLKMVLQGVGVDRCGVCAMQFRDQESAVIGTRCLHAFHERCAGSWLVRGNCSCPTCGLPFE